MALLEMVPRVPFCQGLIAGRGAPPEAGLAGRVDRAHFSADSMREGPHTTAFSSTSYVIMPINSQILPRTCDSSSALLHTIHASCSAAMSVIIALHPQYISIGGEQYHCITR
jgi:hypothetical protein